MHSSFIAKYSLAYILLLVTPSTKADIYEYIENNGQVNYSDSPLDDRYVLIIQEPLSVDTNNIEKKNSIQLDKSITRLSISTPNELLEHIEAASKTYQVDPDLIHAVIYVESSYKMHVKSDKGAIGLMQLMPTTAKRMGVKDIYSPTQNIDGGAKYLRLLLDMFDNDIQLTLAAYNSGEQSVIRFGKRIPPYKETQKYVPKVMRIYEALRKQRAQMSTPL